MNITIILNTDGGIPVGMKVTNLEHLINILKFQSKEKGLDISGELEIK
tara:strand:+ start:1470 stop:1613 length:144 start_codon:yes stop_codon:yes gene_type:complete